MEYEMTIHERPELAGPWSKAIAANNRQLYHALAESNWNCRHPWMFRMST